MSVYSSRQLNELCTNLLAIEEWLRKSCPARHADLMADTLSEAYKVIDDLYDEQRTAEESEAVY